MPLLLLRRGLQAALSAFTPAAGEPLWVTDSKQLRVGDGSTAGGILIPKDQRDRVLLPSRRYTTHLRVGGGSTPVSITQNAIYYLPFYVPHEVTAVEIGLQVETALASSLARVGLYTTGTDHMPDALVVESGALDCSTVGVKVTSISEALQPGLYWLASLCNDLNVLVYGIDKATMQDGLGWRSSFANLGSQHNLLTEAYTYGAMPASATPSSTSSNGNDPPMLFLGF